VEEITLDLKVISWTPEEAEHALKKRFSKCQRIRKERWESQWKTNEALLFGNGKGPINTTLSFRSLAEVFASESVGSSSGSLHIPQVMRNVRILHSQLSANPPSALAEALSNEIEDQHAAKVANHLINYGIYKYKWQEKIDLVTLACQVYGTGFGKCVFDGAKGELLNFDESSGIVQMTGDMSVKPVLLWNMYIDADAECWDDVKYTFERHMFSFEEAMSRFPQYKEKLEQIAVDAGEHPMDFDGFVRGEKGLESSRMDDMENAIIPILEYYEKASPVNGMAGRHCFCLTDGTVLGEMKASPIAEGKLPYSCLTDIDVPGEVYGKTPVDYAVRLSAVVDELDGMILENVEIHGSIHLVVFDGADIDEKSLTENPVDVIKVNGAANQAPFHLSPPPLTGDIYNLRNSTLAAIDAIMGVNEALKGEIPRELSGFAVQQAMNAANMSRRRLYNKYTMFTEDMWKLYLDSVEKNWTIKRKVLIVGKEDAAKVASYSGADLNGGFALKVSYGTMFSLDPAQRRQEILQAQPILEKAGITPKQIAKHLRYDDIEGVFDIVEIAEARQIEIFEKMIAGYHNSGQVKYIPASDMEVAYHAEMAEAGYQYVMSNYFLEQPKEIKQAVYQHIREREEMAAKQAAPQAPAPGMGGGMPGMPPAGGPPGAPPGAIPDIGAVL
jgi:hypothetical protein